MRRPVLLLVACACGQAEQLISFTGRVDANEAPAPPLTLLLQQDEGVTLEGCGEFTTVGSIAAESRQPFSVSLLRAQVIGPRGTPRCFRLDWESPLGGHAEMAWVPTDHDFTLPPFAVWPGPLDSGDTLQVANGALLFFALPQGSLKPTGKEVDVVPARHYVEFLDDGGQVMWRINEGDPGGSFFRGGRSMRVPFGERLFESRVAWARAGGFQLGRQFSLDPLGRGVELRFEYRFVTNVVELGHPVGAVPVSRGAPCGGEQACPFTDGDFRVLPLPAGQTSVTVQLRHEAFVTDVVVRGLWVDGPFFTLKLEFSDGTARIPIDAFVSLARDGISQPRIDLVVQTARFTRDLKLSVIDSEGNALPLVRLAEVSMFAD